VILLALLSIANITLFALSLTGQIGSLWLITFIPYVALTLMRTTRVQPVFAEASSLRDALQQLLAVFEVLENYSYRDTPRLAELCAPFRDPDHRPSRYLKRIGRIVNAMGIRGNGLVALLLNAVVPWDYYFAYQLEQQKVAIRNMLPEWMTAWVEVEAISALATFAYLNPNYTPPQISDAGPWLNAKQLGHPLLPDADKVANDFAVTQLGEIELITGSNMAGKSTFLRTVGVNLVLAYAGSVVDADRLAIRPMRLFTCIRVADSVTDGISYFYAEVQRLRDLLLSLREENELPLFFFVDEIFRGTNNRERLIGSRAYVRALADADGVGMISTHDLELVTLADEIALMHNYHFRETIADGRMVFDYKLQHGPCPTTNALEIMRLEGLPVPTSQSSEV
jgi:DNA mismatch repair ATPase MutS